MAQKKKEKKKKQFPLCDKEANSLNSWPNLPNELINLIGRECTLTCGIYSRSVTKSWRTGSRKCNSYSNTLPWLEVSYDECPIDKTSGRIYHYWSEDYWYYLWTTKNQLPYHAFLGWSHGLLKASSYWCTKEVRHPKLLSRLIFSSRSGRYVSIPPWDFKDQGLLYCAALSSSPIDCEEKKVRMLVLTGISHPAFAFCRVRRGGHYDQYHTKPEDAWTKRDCNIDDPHCSKTSERDCFMRFTNGIGFQDKFYALSLQGTLALIEDIGDSDLRITVLGNQRAVPSVSSMYFRECFVELGGKILLVFLIFKKSVYVVDDIEVYKIDAKTLALTKMMSLGDRTIFLGANCCISVSASRVGCRKNCIYFTHPSIDGWCVYEMENGNISSGWNVDSIKYWVDPTEE